MIHWSSDLSVRAKNVLICLTYQYGYEEVYKLNKEDFRSLFINGQQKNEIQKNLLKVKNCGKKTALEINNFLNLD